MMDSRRRGTKRPPTSDTTETVYWSQARASLNHLNQIQSNPQAIETIAKVNRLMSQLPHDDHPKADNIPFDALRGVKTKLVAGLEDIKKHTDDETAAIREALEHLSALIALRRGYDGDKRTKKIRLSPSSNSDSPLPTGTLSSRPSQGPGSIGSNSTAIRDARSKKEFLAQQLPLQAGRKVAFRQPSSKQGAGGRAHDGAGDTESETWILAVVRRHVEKNKYEVQDDDTEDGEPGQRYIATLKSILPLPDPDAPAHSPSHPNAYDEYAAGTAVMGLYPDTSCFYRAIVVAGPRDPQPGVRTVSSAKSNPMYRLKFEDDDDQVRAVGVQWVVGAP